MANLMKYNVKMAKMKAWIKPTKNSYAIRGTGTMYGVVKNIITIISVFPAKIFPKRRKENDMSRANSLNSSISPITKANGDLKLINLPPYLNNPSINTPASSIETKATIANPMVMFKSVAGGWKKGINLLAASL